MVSGLVMIGALSLRSRAGIFSRPVDFDALIFFSSLQTKSSSTLDKRKMPLDLGDRLLGE